MNHATPIKKRLAIVSTIILGLTGAGAYYLQNIALPRSMEGLAKAVPAMLNATLEQANRLTGPEAVPAGSRIVMGSRTIGDLTLRFKIRRDESVVQRPAATGHRATDLPTVFGNPDSSLILNGRLINGAIARKLRGDSLLVALVVGPFENGRPIVVHVMEQTELGSAVPIGFLWLPADSVMLVLHRGGH